VARGIWTGSITIGLVTIPVGLFSATDSHTVRFNQFQRGTSDRIRYQRVNERTGKEVDYSEIVKGYEVNDGQFVIVEPDELAAIAPGRSRTIEITSFVDLDDIDPIFFQKTYWLAPTKAEHARPYALLAEAMARTNKAGVASFVMRGKQYLADVRADKGILALDTLFYADEIRDPRELLDTLSEVGAPRGKELNMATALIESMSGPWRPEDYRDTFTRQVEKLIDDKRRGHRIMTAAAAPEPTKVIDLMEALRRSVEGSHRHRSRPDLDSASKSELDRMARDLDIKGRSKMSKSELARAVKRQTRRAS